MIVEKNTLIQRDLEIKPGGSGYWERVQANWKRFQPWVDLEKDYLKACLSLLANNFGGIKRREYNTATGECQIFYGSSSKFRLTWSSPKLRIVPLPPDFSLVSQVVVYFG
jgi:hypothetical protein